MSNNEIATTSVVVNNPSERSSFQKAIDELQNAVSEAESAADELEGRVSWELEDGLDALEESNTGILDHARSQLERLCAQVEEIKDALDRLIDGANEYPDDEEEAAS
jgi:exonuclease VII small subunit